jgi:hypothetical protein
MSKGIPLDSPSLSTHYLRMIPYGSDTVMSTGTGFLYEFEDEYFLITNGHNITRTNPEQTQRITSSAAFPVKILTKARTIPKDMPDSMGLSDLFTVSLYEDEDFKLPLWYVHPKHGYLVDVVAIPLSKKDLIPEHLRLFPINRFNFDSEYPLFVADDVYILGYPFNLDGSRELPIWKRGTVATEPSVDIDSLPKLLIDTASRSGMSGSPVIMQRTGIHGYNGKKMMGHEVIGAIRDFIGIYSGRIGAENEFKAQLGIVWRKEVIEEILTAKEKGAIDFQNI